MYIKTIVVAALAASAVASTPVLAADMIYEQSAPQPEQPVSSAYNWLGFYLGGEGGYNFNEGKILGEKEDLNSGSAGIFAGYNWQSGNIVYGIENDFNYNFEKNDGADLEWDASGRGRVGYAFDRTLVFATAGFAAAGGKVDLPGVGKKDLGSSVGDFGATQNKVMFGAGYKF